MPSKPCVCQGSNENCMYCSGRGYVRGKGVAQSRSTTAKRSGSDEHVRQFIAKHPLLNPNPLQQPAGSEAKYRPQPTKEKPDESSSEEIPERSFISASPANVRSVHLRPSKQTAPVIDVMKIAKEITTSTCPTCHVQFAHYIDLVAHQQAGCPKPNVPIRRLRYIPPEQVRKSRNKSVFNAPRKMTNCSYCGCPVKTTNLQKHLGRCPKYSASHIKTSTKWNVQRPKSGKTPDQRTVHSAADAKRPDPRTQFAQANGLEPIDATKQYAHSFRENGKYGSHPLHDGMDDESGPE
jgi:hypothetical protein